MSSLQISPRKHGLQLPFNKYQTMSWGLFGAELVATVLVFIPPLEDSLRIAGGTIMLFLLCSTFFCAFKSSFTDPTDPTVYEERKSREKGEDFVTELKHYCSICDTHVLPRTKHCGQCNRCVNIFDHHCQWLNNCVGARNYAYFARTVALLFLNSSVKIGFGAYIVNKFYRESVEFDEQAQQFYGTDISLGFLNYFVIISCALNVIFWLMMFQLIILHLYLHSQKLTTYEYIVKKREKRAMAKAQKEGQQVDQVKKSKVIRQLNDEDQTGRSLPPRSEDYTAVRLVNRSKPSVSYDQSHFYASHDLTKDHQEYLRHKVPERPETGEPFGTCVTSLVTHGTLINPEKKIKPVNLTPAAVLHETSMSSDFSVNESNSMHNNNKNGGLYEKETKDMPESATKSPKSFSIIKEKAEEDIATMRDQYAPRIQEEIRNLSFPEVIEAMDCDLTVDKSQETSKIIRFMETISENVVMRNPLGKLMFVKSGIDVDPHGSHLVTSPKDIQKRPLPKLDFYKNLQNFKPIESPHELKLLKSDLYYINSPNTRLDPMFSPSTLLPNSCRIQLDKKPEHVGSHSYVTERPTYFDSGLTPQEFDGVAEDRPISKAGFTKTQQEGAFKNPFFQNYQSDE